MDSFSQSIGVINENYLRKEAAKMFGTDWAKQWTTKSIYNLVAQVKDVLPYPEDDSLLRKAAIKLCPHLLPVLKDYLTSIHTFMKRYYNIQSVAVPTTESYSSILKKYLAVVNENQPINYVHKYQLIRIKSAISVLESDDPKRDWEPMLSCEGPGVLLVVIAVKAAAWMKDRKDSTVLDFLSTIKDPLVEFQDELEIDMRGYVSMVAGHLVIQNGEAKTSLSALGAARKQMELVARVSEW
eukprot:CAMPEP_0170067460 /NCGR_PEP_ID=MMETSP0019_2-20121128/6798_1 /TAXON_ID=98059 /ORGANISM="Dinobryon sp., Strain UTEXLB2267" /LENGTH=239 /DNA_ID=CAMNT_0010274853 /DNA_START=162 /DNA_END=878 /DNA_ORIENTATION=-